MAAEEGAREKTRAMSRRAVSLTVRTAVDLRMVRRMHARRRAIMRLLRERGA